MDILEEIANVSALAGYEHREYPQEIRRVAKLSEEVGELAQAYLDFTSTNPRRGKTALDVIEEACDVSIVALDLALSMGEKECVEEMIAKKLARWAKRLAKV